MAIAEQLILPMTAVRRDLCQLVEGVDRQQNEVIITRNGQPIAKLVHLEYGRQASDMPVWAPAFRRATLEVLEDAIERALARDSPLNRLV